MSFCVTRSKDKFMAYTAQFMHAFYRKRMWLEEINEKWWPCFCGGADALVGCRWQEDLSIGFPGLAAAENSCVVPPATGRRGRRHHFCTYTIGIEGVGPLALKEFIVNRFSHLTVAAINCRGYRPC